MCIRDSPDPVIGALPVLPDEADEGLLQPQGHDPQHWLFAGDALPRTRRALRLARDFGLDLAAVALVMELLAEIARLRSRQRPP